MNCKNLLFTAACLYATYNNLVNNKNKFDCKGFKIIGQKIHPGENVCNTFANTGSRPVATFFDKQNGNTTTTFEYHIVALEKEYSKNPHVDFTLCFVTSELKKCRKHLRVEPDKSCTMQKCMQGKSG